MDEKGIQPEISTENTVDPHCTACDMPMTKAEDFGTNEDGSRNEQYCCHCMQKGTLM